MVSINTRGTQLTELQKLEIIRQYITHEDSYEREYVIDILLGLDDSVVVDSYTEEGYKQNTDYITIYRINYTGDVIYIKLTDSGRVMDITEVEPEIITKTVYKEKR